MELMETSKIRLSINSVPIASARSLHQNDFAVPVVPSLSDVFSSLRVQQDPAFISNTDHNLMRNLSKGNLESLAQSAVTPVVTALGGQDTSASSPGIFHHALSMRDKHGKEYSAVYPLSAKPDLNKIVGHVQLELKSTPGEGTFEGILVQNDFEVIYQSADRIYTTRNTTAYTRLAVCFAATGRSAWIVVFTRGDEEEDFIEKVNFVRIRHADIFTILRSVRDLQWDHYWFEDAFLIRAVLATLGYDANHCCVRLIGRSTCNVYALSFPRKRLHIGSKSTEVGVCASEPDCCVKVCRDVGRFEREVAALHATAHTYARHDDGKFYALGAVRVAPGGIVHTISTTTSPSYDMRLQQFLQLNPDRLFLHWNTDEFALPTDINTLLPTTHLVGDYCGAILMKVGAKVDIHNTSIAECVSGLLYSLEKLHESAYLHTDLRLGNYLKFGSGNVQCIDFDNSVQMNPDVPGTARITILRGSTQHAYVGERIRAVFAKHPDEQEVVVHWSTADDIEMCLVAILSGGN